MILYNLHRFNIILTLIICLSSCNSRIDYRLHTDVSKYSSDSFDIQQTIGKNYKIVSSKIRNGKLLMIAIDNNEDSYFTIADARNKKINYITKNTVGNYYSIIWDASDNNLVAASAHRPYDLTIINTKTNQVDKRQLHNNDWLSAVDIAINNEQLFYLNGVLGVAFADLKNNNISLFKNPGILTSDYRSCTLAYPLDTALNLLSGHTIATNTMQLYAITSQDSILWKYSIVQTQQTEPVSLLNYSTSFIIKYDSILTAMDKKNGKEFWRTTLQSSISEIYKWQDKVLTYCLVNPKGTYPDKDDFEYKVFLKLFDSRDGKQLWDKEITSINLPHIGICGNILLLSDNRSFSVFSLNDGSVVEKKNFSTNNKNYYAFEMLIDIKTGDYYLKSYDGKIHW